MLPRGWLLLPMLPFLLGTLRLLLLVARRSGLGFGDFALLFGLLLSLLSALGLFLFTCGAGLGFGGSALLFGLLLSLLGALGLLLLVACGAGLGFGGSALWLSLLFLLNFGLLRWLNRLSLFHVA